MPPTGDLRFRPPVKYTTDQVGMAVKTHGNICVQARGGDEDCLFLDVYAPATKGDTPKAVMFWVHGGCYVAGGPAGYRGSHLVETGDVIVVVAHYRLGVFGFLGADQLRERDEEHASTGNYGQLDLVEALKWVQTNISSFGGDPNNVTIFGQSSGAGSVAGIVSMPEVFTVVDSRPLFHAAIIQSGGYAPWSSQPMKQAQDQYTEIMNYLDCNTDDVDCLIQTDSATLAKAFDKLNTWKNPTCRDGC